MEQKLPSALQPEAMRKKQAIELIEYLMAQKPPQESTARQVDKQEKLGYFTQLDNAKAPVTNQILDTFITCHPDMIAMKEQTRILAGHTDNVLILGESGTGKEILARALHGAKVSTSWVAINCAGLPEYLLESELFGHERGSFSGAHERKYGLFKQAGGGTLFLDEIGDLPMSLQAKLLRAIQDRKIRRVGATVEEDISCRFVAATHHDLPSLVKQKLFRLDLFYRLNTFTLQTKPLHPERGMDIPLIVQSLDPSGQVPHLRELKAWTGYDLSGNVRSIQQRVRREQVFRTK